MPWGKEGRHKETVVSCALPVDSTTGMSVSVILPRTAMLDCSSFEERYEKRIWSASSGEAGVGLFPST